MDTSRFKKELHKKTLITIIDYSGLSCDDEVEFIEWIEINTQLVERNVAGKLYLIDVTNTFLNSAITTKFKESARRCKPHFRKMAVLGVTGYKSMLLSAVNLFAKTDIKAFTDLQKAKDWLVAE